MFEFLKEFFNRKTSKLKKLKYQKLELIYNISRELCELDSPDYYHLRKGLGIASVNSKPDKMFCYTIKFKIDDKILNYCYQIRGSLINITNKDEDILSFVDQTIQYDGCLYYPHDIQIKCSKMTLENLLRDIKIKLTELKELKYENKY
jgi:hypothetical protein